MKARFLLALLPLLFVAGAKKQPTLTVRFHTETTARGESNFARAITLQYPPRQIFIGAVPDVSERNVEAIYPFTAADGTYGCSFKLDYSGALALATVSTDRRGASMVAYLNNRQVIDMQIDKPVRDGIITIPRGLAGAEIQALTNKYRILGQPKGKKKK